MFRGKKLSSNSENRRRTVSGGHGGDGGGGGRCRGGMNSVSPVSITATSVNHHCRGHRSARVAMSRMDETKKSLGSSAAYRRGGGGCGNLLAIRAAPLVLFVAICYLVVANITCDPVGSTNDVLSLMSQDHKTTESVQQQEQKLEPGSVVKESNSSSSKNPSLPSSSAQEDSAQSSVQFSVVTTPTNANKPDPLSFLREIYLDQNSKIVTMLDSPQDSVQKFHPNGRYGRRSVGSSGPSSDHMELGKLRYIENSSGSLNSDPLGKEPLRSLLLHSFIAGRPPPTASLDDDSSLQLRRNQLLPRPPSDFLTTTMDEAENSLPAGDVANGANLRTELSKMLKCNYTGLNYLYWCKTAS